MLSIALFILLITDVTVLYLQCFITCLNYIDFSVGFEMPLFAFGIGLKSHLKIGIAVCKGKAYRGKPK